MFNLEFEFAVKAKLAEIRERMAMGYTTDQADIEMEDMSLLNTLEAKAIQLGIE